MTAGGFIDAFIGIVSRMAPWLLLGFLFAGLFALFFTPELVKRHLGGTGVVPVLKAVLLGVPLPLCSCGVVPVAAALRSSGASRGATAAFFISTPQTGVDSMIVTFSLLGWLIGLLRPVLAIVTGLVGGVAIGRLVDKREAEAQNAARELSEEGESCCCAGGMVRQPGFWGGVRYVFWYGFIRTPKTVSSSLLLGLVIATVLQLVVPDDFGASFIKGNRLLEFAAVIALALPLYVCSTGAIPIAATMILKGISPGAALLFMIAGPATNSAMMASMVKLLGARATVIYLVILTVFAVLAGMLVNMLGCTFNVQGGMYGHGMAEMTLVQRGCGTVLLLLLGWGMYRKITRS